MDYTSLAAGSYLPTDPAFKPRMNTDDPSVRVPTKNTDYSADYPVTYYSYEMKRTESCGFPATFVRSTNPFRKCTHFSNDIRYSFGKEAETHERFKQLPTCKDYAVLYRMRNRLLSLSKSAIPGATVALILDNLYKLEIFRNGKCKLDELCSMLKSSIVGVEITSEEMIALSHTFDLDNDDHLYIRELIGFFRPSLSARREELLMIAFSICDQSGVGFLTEEDLRKCFNKDGFYHYLGNSISSADQAASFFFQSFQDYLGNSGTIDFEDFTEYYSCVSAEILRDNSFEKLLVSQWNLPKCNDSCEIVS